jgi:hypothetical protein
MSTMTVAVIAENAVFLAVIAAGWSLLRQGGGLQAKTPPPPKAEPQQKRGPKAEAPPAANPEVEETAPFPKAVAS